MTRLRQGLIILVAGLFLVVVSIGGTQAGTSVKSSKSNSSDVSSPSPSDATTVKSSKSNSSERKKATTINSTKSNTFKGKDLTTDSINLNSSRSNIYRDTSSNDVQPPKGTKTLKSGKDKSSGAEIQTETGSTTSY
jgi:hypothetical protein